jgi:GT2 family glycosyltransferase
MTRVVPVTVAIATRDRPDALRTCLHAIASGDVLPAEVIIIDQGKDASAHEVCEASRGRLNIVYATQAARGLAAAQNEAVRAATSPIIAVTDDDCIPDARWLMVIADVFAGSPGIDAVTGRVLAAPSRGDRVLAVSTRPSEQRRDFAGRSVPWHIGSGNNFAVKRDLYQRIGGCDERLGPGAPAQGGVDMDLFYRLVRAGARIRYEPDALVLHERQTPRERAMRRPMYGHGMGACFALWLRSGDLYTVPAALRWIALRASRVIRPRDMSRGVALAEESAILKATARGFVFGLRVSKMPADIRTP